MGRRRPYIFPCVPGRGKRPRSDRDYRRALRETVVRKRKGAQRSTFATADGFAQTVDFKWCAAEMAALQHCVLRIWNEEVWASPPEGVLSQGFDCFAIPLSTFTFKGPLKFSEEQGSGSQVQNEVVQ